MTNYEKYQKSLERKKALEINWYRWKLGIKKDTPQEEINEKVLKSAKKEEFLTDIKLSDSQLNDKEFMKKLYAVNPKLMTSHLPTEELMKDLEYMADYISNYFNKLISGNSFYNELQYSFGGETEHLMGNSEFVQILAKKMPDQNMMKVLNAFKNRITAFTPKMYDVKLQQYYDYIEEFPIKFWISQAEKFGAEFLEYLPQQYSKHTDLVKSAVEKDGFDSLKYMKLDDILENKDMLFIACGISGEDRLEEFINKDLQPRRDKFYICNGVQHFYSEYDNQYEEVQKALLEDEGVMGIINGSSNAII